MYILYVYIICIYYMYILYIYILYIMGISTPMMQICVRAW